MGNILDINTTQNIIPHVSIVIDRLCYPGWSVPRRTIRDQELVLVIGGNGSFFIEEKEHPVQPGMLFYFYPDLVHSATTGLNPPMHFIAVHFTLASGEYDGNKWSFNSDLLYLPLKPVQQLSNWDNALRILKELHQTWSQKKIGYQWKSSILLQHFFYEIIQDRTSPKESHINICRVNQAIDYIKANYNTHLSVKELSSLFGISCGYFTEIFKSVTGKTPIEYINQIRIDKSKELLLNTTLKIKEIALKAGFKDEFYFSRVFKKLEGCSPSQFIQRTIR